MEIISSSKDGKKFTINSSHAFVEYASKVNLSNMQFQGFLDGLKKIINDEAFKRNGTINEGSFNKCNGDWYEWFIAIRAVEYFLENRTNCLLIKMPNASSFDVISIYKKFLSEYILDLREKLKLNNVNLITSNPDFAVVKINALSPDILNILKEISFENITLSTLIKVDNLYKFFQDYAELDDVTSFLSVKTTFRPDRRLQLAHEGSLMKALYTHLQTRTWSINPSGVKYYAATTKVGKADIEGLKTVATHSITDVKSLPQSAVDRIFKINSLQEVDQCLDYLLSNFSK
ncbi:Cfr10I/Bse634I family restriction endonuclease [Enterobacter kobei]|uniref:Cfr10I/Bse634I family restriction endonuclease n=2 Tax=Enterobacter kobei TaxID=208224 RepID=UPI003BBD68A8